MRASTIRRNHSTFNQERPACVTANLVRRAIPTVAAAHRVAGTDKITTDILTFQAQHIRVGPARLLASVLLSSILLDDPFKFVNQMTYETLCPRPTTRNSEGPFGAGLPLFLVANPIPVPPFSDESMTHRRTPARRAVRSHSNPQNKFRTRHLPRGLFLFDYDGNGRANIR